MNEINKQNEMIEKQSNNKEDNKIKKLLDKSNELINNIDLTSKLEKEIDEINEGNKIKNEEYNNKFLNQNNIINNINENIELIKEEIKEINNKIKINENDIKKMENNIKEKEIIISNINEKTDNQINIKNENNNNIESVEKNL